MTDIYIHIWKDSKGVPLIMESNLALGFDCAVREYDQQQGCFTYSHSLKLNTESNTWQIVHMENIFEAKEDEERHEQLQDIRYGSYEDQVRSHYNSTRI